ncbi:NAD(P)H nitroreductase [soil metagenome]
MPHLPELAPAERTVISAATDDASVRPAVPAADPAMRVIEFACRAPSVQNTQPWAWRAHDTTLELYADRSRGLHGADPHGRNLLISCGSALHHAAVAARGLAWEPIITRRNDLPEAEPDLIARIELVPSTGARESPEPAVENEAAADLQALTQRRTDRRRFTSWPVQDVQLQVLCAAASGHGGLAVPVTVVVDRLRVEHLLRRAARADPVPASASNATLPGHDDQVDVEPSDGLLLLCSETDDPAAWVTVGEALSALWLSAVRRGLSVVPLSNIISFAETRAALRSDVLGGLALPQLLLRVGWQPIGRSDLARSPRRPLGDVLLA